MWWEVKQSVRLCEAEGRVDRRTRSPRQRKISSSSPQTRSLIHSQTLRLVLADFAHAKGHHQEDSRSWKLLLASRGRKAVCHSDHDAVIQQARLHQLASRGDVSSYTLVSTSFARRQDKEAVQRHNLEGGKAKVCALGICWRQVLTRRYSDLCSQSTHFSLNYQFRA